MSAMTIKAPIGPLTAGTLLNYLEEMRDAWTEEDTKYLGEFEHQKINTDHYNEFGAYQGIGPSEILYHGGLDFIISKPQQPRVVIEELQFDEIVVMQGGVAQ